MVEAFRSTAVQLKSAILMYGEEEDTRILDAVLGGVPRDLGRGHGGARGTQGAGGGGDRATRALQPHLHQDLGESKAQRKKDKWGDEGEKLANCSPSPVRSFRVRRFTEGAEELQLAKEQQAQMRVRKEQREPKALHWAANSACSPRPRLLERRACVRISAAIAARLCTCLHVSSCPSACVSGGSAGERHVDTQKKEEEKRHKRKKESLKEQAEEREVRNTLPFAATHIHHRHSCAASLRTLF